MAVTDNRKEALAEVRLYDKGGGDPVIRDKGLAWHDILSESFQYGQVSLNGLEPTLEILEKSSRHVSPLSGRTKKHEEQTSGLVCRPFFSPQDTLLTDYTVHNTSDWENTAPLVGGTPRHQRLFMSNGNPNVQYWATSVFEHPINPNCAFTLLYLDTPADHDLTLYPPYVRIELGNGAVALEFSKLYGARVLSYDRTLGWIYVGKLNEPVHYMKEELGERIVAIRWHRGRMFISTDGGMNWDVFFPKDNSPMICPAGQITFRGQGGVCAFGLHQLKYYPGVYLSMPRPTFTTRFFLPTPTITPWLGFVPTNLAAGGSPYVLPDGTSITFEDLAGEDYAQYQAELTPAVVQSFPWDWYVSPELYSVDYEYPVVADEPTGGYTTPWTDESDRTRRLNKISLNEDHELDQRSCDLEISESLAAQYAFDGKYRKIVVRTGESHIDGTPATWWTVFTGYVEPQTPSQQQFGEKPVAIHLTGAATRAKRMKWSELVGMVPFDGMTVNAALDKVLASMGLSAADRSWWGTGASITIPLGIPEKPSLIPLDGETKWDTMKKIVRWANLEIFCDELGVWRTYPKGQTTFANHLFDLAPTSGDIKGMVKKIEYRYDSSQNVTSVTAKGQDLWGISFWVYLVDTEAEGTLLSHKFATWPEVIEYEWGETISLWFLMYQLYEAYYDQMVPKYELVVTVPVNWNTSRLDTLNVLNDLLGIDDTDQFVILEIQSAWVPGSDFEGCTQTLTARKLLW